jgi:phosphoribosyl-ATP pyrophosphohydrolase/phosphoribosyl-AMP cyclohydrolase/histidinol dehydrogenase
VKTQVIADSTANPAYVASDLLSQAEHGPDSQVMLLAVNLSDEQLSAIEDQIHRQASVLPRVDIVRECISKSHIVKCGTLDEALDLSNDYAPEHLILHLENAPAAVDQVRNAGSVFVGEFSPERFACTVPSFVFVTVLIHAFFFRVYILYSCGDYASGTNHTLPTYSYARQYSGVSTSTFLKHITSQQLTREGLEKLGPIVVHLADLEGLTAHGNAVRVRLGGLNV